MSAAVSLAGPVIIDGTDANEHGFFSGGANQVGWLYMESALENIGGQVGNGNKVVVNIGAASSTAEDAFNSAFNNSSLPGAGWTSVLIDGATDINAFFSGTEVNGVTLAETGIIYLPTYNNAGGDLSFDEMAAVNANAIPIRDFVGGAGDPTQGGGLFSMAESGTGAYGWLTTLIPGIIATDSGDSTPIELTAAGALAFPGLPASDVANAVPWHGQFSGNLGSLQVLGTALQGGIARNVILGGGAGTIIDPEPPTGVPESMPAWAVLSFLGAVTLVGTRVRRATS